MRRPAGGLFVVALAAVLVACSPGGSGGYGGASMEPSPPATSGPTPSLSATATSAGLDGTWVVQLDDPNASCVVVHERLVQIVHGTATLSPTIAGLVDHPPMLSGPATLDGTAIGFTAVNADPSKDEIDFAGTVGADGIAHGTMTASGIHPGLTNGYTCQFAATLVHLSAPTSVECTPEVVQAALNTAPGRTQFVTIKVKQTQLVCSGDWVFATPQIVLEDGTPSLGNELLHVENGAWTVTDFVAECASRRAPEALLFACP